MSITSVSIKNMSPKQLYLIDKTFMGDGKERICKYIRSERSITEFKDVKTGEIINVLRGQMKYVSLV